MKHKNKNNQTRHTKPEGRLTTDYTLTAKGVISKDKNGEIHNLKDIVKMMEMAKKAERERILTLLKSLKVRQTISYPTMLNHHYISERDFRAIIQEINTEEETAK